MMTKTHVRSTLTFIFFFKNKTDAPEYYRNLFSLISFITSSHPLPIPLDWSELLFQLSKKITGWFRFFPEHFLSDPQNYLNSLVEVTLRSHSISKVPACLGSSIDPSAYV